MYLVELDFTKVENYVNINIIYNETQFQRTKKTITFTIFTEKARNYIHYCLNNFLSFWMLVQKAFYLLYIFFNHPFFIYQIHVA